MSQPTASTAARVARPAASSGTATAVAEPPGLPASAPTQATSGRDTPQLLRSLTTALIVVGLLFGLTGAASVAGLAAALHRAESDTAQLIRVQQIQTNLLSADATATNAFLVGGLEAPAQRASYDQAISTSSVLIADAADAQPADGEAMSALNRAVVDYAVTIEQARANNRQGFPVGSQYLRNASADLRSRALPILDNLVQANSTRAGQAMNSHLGLLFELVGLLGLAALVASMIWVARRFRRRINPGLVGATAVVLVVWVTGSVLLTQVASQADDIRNGSFSSVNSAAAARIEANDAKSNESLTLIARGSGASFEKAWVDSAQTVDRQLSQPRLADLSPSWRAYTSTHQQIRRLDDGGSWEAAVRLATGTNPKSSNATFASFDLAATRFLDSAGRQTSQGLAAPQPLLVVLAILTFLAGLAAALLSRAGLAARLREYR